MSEELIKLLRDGVPCADPDAGNGEGSFFIDDANETMREAADRIAALIAAGDKLANSGDHHEDCPTMWGDVCSQMCGLSKARKAWREARDA